MEHLATSTEGIEQLHREVAAVRRELDVNRRRLHRELELAAKVHRSLLPKPVCDPRIHVDVRYIPIEEIGGDYCQVRFADRDTCYVTIWDVTGHGIGSALLATRVSSEVRYGVLYGRQPRGIVRSLNKFIYDHFNETDLYLTFFVAQIDLERRRITYCGSGHPSPLLIRRNEAKVELLHSQNPMIGILEDCLSNEPEHTVDLERGDRLLFYTDGLTETADADGRQLGANGLAKVAATAMSVDLFEMADHVLDRISCHEHGPATDDKTLIVAEIK